MIPSAFVDRLQKLGLDISLYEKYPRKSVHILRNEDEIVDMFTLEQIPWAENCYWADEPREIQDRYYTSAFIQDAGSVVPVLALDIDSSDCVVDMCAAPGSKTLHLARRAQHVISVDSHPQRIKRLNHNISRFDIKNCAVLHADGRTLRLCQQIDKLLVDAPCTGEGMVNKIHKAMRLWSLKRIKRMSHIQKQLVLNGVSLLKEGGVLVYSTCTFAPEENEEVVDYLLNKRSVELEQISIEHLQHSSGLTQWRGKEYSPLMKKTIRIYPFQNCTNGFFVARIRKLGK
jgi:NOL1/NOP2/sun family putative RNA methylase